MEQKPGEPEESRILCFFGRVIVTILLFPAFLVNLQNQQIWGRLLYIASKSSPIPEFFRRLLTFPAFVPYREGTENIRPPDRRRIGTDITKGTAATFTADLTAGGKTAMNEKLGMACMIVGVLLLASAVLLLFYNRPARPSSARA